MGKLTSSVVRAFCACAMASLLVAADKSNMPPNALTKNRLEREFIGNTIISMPNSPMSFSEFHALEGQIYGYNDDVVNNRSCWRVVQNQICYAYRGQETCYFVVKSGSSYNFYWEGSLMHQATIRRGNPLKHRAMPETWSCPQASASDQLVQPVQATNPSIAGR